MLISHNWNNEFLICAMNFRSFEFWSDFSVWDHMVLYMRKTKCEGRTFADAPSLSDVLAFLWQLGEMLTSGGLKQGPIEEYSAFW